MNIGKRVFAACVAAAMLLCGSSAFAVGERLPRPQVLIDVKGAPHVPSVPAGNSATYSATTVGGPTYTRAVETCAALSGVGVGVRYHVQPFTVATTGSYSVTMTVGEPTYDEFIFVYQNVFDPANAVTNCLAGDDDGAAVGDPPTIAAVALTAGTNYFVVTTGFAPADVGTFTNVIDGPGQVTLGGAGPSADLGIVKTNPGGVIVGGTFTYELDAINNGPSAATAVVVTDTLPAGVTLVSNDCGATAAGSTVTWNIGNMANGGTANCTLTVTLAGMCMALTNTASIDGAEADPVAANNMSSTSNGGGNVVADPGFEAGTPNPSWAETSTNFGTPICDVAGCSAGAGTGPRTGTFWTWFGGFPGGIESGSITQSVVIPTGAPSITFFTEFPVCNNGASDFVRLLIDGTEVWRADSTSSRCGLIGYVQQTVPLGAFANGAAHTVRFESTTVGGGVSSNFFIDDVSITGTPTCGSGAANLAISQSNNAAGTALMIGNTFQKTLTVTNNGSAAVTAITVTDTLPAQLAFVSSNCGATAVGQVVTFTIPTLAAGAASSCVLTVRIATAGTITNTASITSSTPPDTTPADNTTTAQIGPTGGGTAQVAVPALDRNMVLVLLGLFTLVGALALRQRNA